MLEPALKLANVDYLTMTWPSSAEDGIMNYGARLIEWYRATFALDGGTWQVKPFVWQGYLGWQIGTMSWGARPDGSVIRISGGAAQEYLEADWPTGHNCSRLDISLTVWGVSDIDQTIARHNAEALVARNSLHCRPFQVRHIITAGDGDTLYLGSRSSEIFARIYNKEKEQKDDEHYRGAIRYEVEYKGETARQALERGRSQRHDRREYAAMALATMESRGIDVRGDWDARRHILARVGRAHSDAWNKLEWLRTQVAPTVRWLIDNGHGDDILSALGLYEAAESRTKLRP